MCSKFGVFVMTWAIEFWKIWTFCTSYWQFRSIKNYNNQDYPYCWQELWQEPRGVGADLGRTTERKRKDSKFAIQRIWLLKSLSSSLYCMMDFSKCPTKKNAPAARWMHSNHPSSINPGPQPRVTHTYFFKTGTLTSKREQLDRDQQGHSRKCFETNMIESSNRRRAFLVKSAIQLSEKMS